MKQRYFKLADNTIADKTIFGSEPVSVKKLLPKLNGHNTLGDPNTPERRRESGGNEDEQTQT